MKHIYICLLFLLNTGILFAQTKPIALDWQYGTGGYDLGKAGVLAADLDGDGNSEIIASGKHGESSFITIQQYDEMTKTYVMKWISRAYASEITSLQLHDFNGDGVSEIYLGFAEGKVVVYHSRTLEEISSFDVVRKKSSSRIYLPNAVTDIEFSRIDNDNPPFMVVLAKDSTYIYNRSFQLVNRLPYMARHCKVGDIDNNMRPDIVYSDGRVVELSDKEHSLVYTFETVNKNVDIGLSDLNGDGVPDIIYSSAYSIHAFDYRNKKPLWTTDWSAHSRYSSYISGLWVYDYDQDGVKDVLVGQSSFDGIYGYNGKTGTKDFDFYEFSNDGITNAAVSDLDGDSNPELVWTTGANCSCDDFFFVYDLTTKKKEWKSKYFSTGYKAFDVGDVDNDGKPDVALGTYGGYSKFYQHGFLSVFDAATKQLKWQNEDDRESVRADDYTFVRIGDVDGDGKNELLLGIKYGYSESYVYVFNPDYTVQRRFAIDGMSIIAGIEIADIDRDGNPELIVTSGTNVSGSTHPDEWQNYIYIFDGKTGTVKWKSPQLGGMASRIGSVKVGNIDEDDALEVVAVQYESFRDPQSKLLVIDGKSHELVIRPMDINVVDLVDFDQDGTDDVLVGSTNGKVTLLGGPDLEERKSFELGSGQLNALKAVDLSRNGQYQFVAADSYKLYIYDAGQMQVKWQSDSLGGGTAGIYNSLVVQDLDGDGHLDILLNGGHALYAFEVLDYDALNIVTSVDDPFEDRSGRSITAYPNPFEGTLKFQFQPVSKPAAYEVKLFNLQGQEVVSRSGSIRQEETTIEIDVSPIPKGMYIYRVLLGNKVIGSGKVLK
ncbi:T9SS type A sorting domain-containing protein [Pontibacter lucknowensis]|uniref:Por secretion system C-terminal sorting domain-containing protein n=1 Tax=Pontibacter lucknowensis TaxID=1077936 RepID=A0A1N6XAT2_9BACT|nr:T9SS type A sorting domain-containing protein [Pontibacter lucknowensis]SIQ99423.1 Por secretion system C-terminal sorting domain-containing protein [Pontibacter lucknowensis]